MKVSAQPAHNARLLAKAAVVHAPVLYRKCACSGTPGPSGECEECRKKRGGMLQRYALTAQPTASVPPIVHDVLRSPGQPLDGDTRTLMEPRLGHDFSKVRVHTDARAAESASMVNALAYTVGHNIVFGSEQYAPHTNVGRKLIAHELTHVVQQTPGRTSGTLNTSTLQVSEPDDSGEQQAKAQALQVLDAPMADPTLVKARLGVAILQRQEAVPVPTPTANLGVCGPDVTQRISEALAKLKSDFGGVPVKQQDDLCDTLDHLPIALVTWDINDLHNNAWILSYRADGCATSGADPRCGSSVQIGTECYYAGSANYVVFGVMCRLCHDHFIGTPDAARFDESRMLRLIKEYKGWGLLGANISTAEGWASAGYNGWPAGGIAPAGDRSNCSPTCPTSPNLILPFDIRWCPYFDPRSGCPTGRFRPLIGSQE